MIGAKQAETLLQLKAGYVIMRKGDPYAALRKRGLVADSATYERGGVEFERKGGKEWPTVTRKGAEELRAFVARHGRLEVAVVSPFADYATVIRMDPEPS